MTTKLLGQSKVIVKDGAFQVVHDKFNDHIRVTGKSEVWFDKEEGLYVIRKGFMRSNCVTDKLSEQNLRSIYNQIGKILKIKGHKVSRPTKNPS